MFLSKAIVQAWKNLQSCWIMFDLICKLWEYTFTEMICITEIPLAINNTVLSKNVKIKYFLFVDGARKLQ